MPNLANVDYVERVNRAIDHITKHLAEPLPLDDVAAVAGFSSFHFHRIFKTLTGETLAQFVKRLRLERAVHLLSHQREASLTEIALATGFQSSSDFSRSFKSHFGCPPRSFDALAYRDAHRPAFLGARLPVGANPDGFEVRLVDVPARRVAYTRASNAYAGGMKAQLQAMVDWARANGLAGGQWLGYQWDDPEIVALEHCRYDIGLELPAGVQVDWPVIDFRPMRLAEIAIAGDIQLEIRAIDYLFTTWLPASGYAPDHQPMFEAWNGEPFAHGDQHFELRCQLAVI